MSERFPGGYLTSTPPTPTSSVTPGVWTLDQALQNVKGGTWPPNGPFYIEDVFSTYLYRGNNSTQTINNGIDLAGKGGLVWIKNRENDPSNNFLFDTLRGAGNYLRSNQNTAQGNFSPLFSSFNSNGFSLNGTSSDLNSSTFTYVSWSLREQPKFFDVVTYTGDSSPRNIAHNLGSVPGCVIIKRIDSTGQWAVWHRSGNQTNGKYGAYLDSTGPYVNQATNLWGSETTAPDMNALTFSVGTDGVVNSNGYTYIAYLFAHNAGGFGPTGTDNVISCGSYVGNGSATGPVIDLGYEPQWLMTKNASTNLTQNWLITDNMRGFFNGATNDPQLFANLNNAEGFANRLNPTATGFDVVSANSEVNFSGETYIYIAIRRGPMAVPTDGTKVFSPLAVNNATGTVNTTGFPVDLQMQFYRPGGINPGTSQWIDRSRGLSSTSTDTGPRLYTTGTQAEVITAIGTLFNNTGFSTGASWASVSMSYNNLRRAPGFFDIVCWTSTGSAQTLNHNLGVVPELMIRKVRNGTWEGWMVYAALLGNTKILYLDQTAAQDTNNGWNNQTPTSTQFFVNNTLNNYTFVTYLFATCPGVSKVGSYTGTGTTLQVNCGFTGGARFVLIKRTDSTGDWYVWDSARGIVAGNDPYLLLNSTAAEVTSTDYVDTFASGFEISSTAPAAINANGGTFIFLAIA